MRQKLISMVCIVAIPTFGAADETGTERVTSVVSTQSNGAVLTNAISYNAQGLPAQYDITSSGPVSMTIATNLTYNTDNQIIRLEAKTESPFGTQTDEATYTYAPNDDGRLISVQTIVSNGYTITKQFAYGTDGRVIGMTMEGVGPDGPISATHSLVYDELGRIIRNNQTHTANGSQHTSFYDVMYDEEGTVIAHTKKQPLSAEVSGTYSYTPQTITVNETTPSSDGIAGLSVAIVSTYAPGPCVIPRITDGFVVEQIFNAPPGFVPETGCRR